jgi:uncharacterized protein (TIGR00730 family)
MTESEKTDHLFPSAEEDADAAVLVPDTKQARSQSYRLAYTDVDFLLRDELRPVRLQLELLKPELLQQENGIQSTVVVFGSARIPDLQTATERVQKAELQLRSNPDDVILAHKVKVARNIHTKAHYYDHARELGHMITAESRHKGNCELVVITGGGPGIMEAANRGAMDVGGKSIGLNIVLPHEQQPNSYITPELNFQFHYFAIRKMHFLMRARALVAFPGGFGTLDELFETLTLIQTKKIKPVPVLLFGREYWQRIINFEALVDEGAIDPQDIELFQYVETAKQAWEIIQTFQASDSHR